MEMKNYFFNGKTIAFVGNEAIGDNQVFDETEIIEAFAETLKDLRKSAGLSTTELSKTIGIPQQTLSAYENGRNTPSLLQAVRICAFFECSIEDFIAYGLDIGAYDIVEKFCERVNLNRAMKKDS